jgi:hypothetical protein
MANVAVRKSERLFLARYNPGSILGPEASHPEWVNSQPLEDNDKTTLQERQKCGLRPKIWRKLSGNHI